MFIPVKVKPLAGYQLWVQFSDGTEGIADLSHLAGHGVFSSWKLAGEFEKVYIDSEKKTVAWSNELDVCSDELYMQISGKTIEDLYNLQQP